MDESGFFTFPLSVCVLYVKGSWSLKSLQVDKRHHLHTTIISHAGISSKNVPTTSLWFLHHNKGVFRLKIALHFNTHRPAFLQVPVRWGTLNLEVQIEGLLDTKSMGVLRELDMAQRFSLYYFWDIFTNRGPWERDMTRKQTRERKYILSLSLRVSNSCHSYNDLLCPNACDANSRISTTLHHTVYILPGLCACALCLDWLLHRVTFWTTVAGTYFRVRSSLFKSGICTTDSNLITVCKPFVFCQTIYTPHELNSIPRIWVDLLCPVQLKLIYFTRIFSRF